MSSGGDKCADAIHDNAENQTCKQEVEKRLNLALTETFCRYIYYIGILRCDVSGILHANLFENVEFSVCLIFQETAVIGQEFFGSEIGNRAIHDSLRIPVVKTGCNSGC